MNSQDYLPYFKSLKSFFEEGDAKRLKERLVEDITESTKHVLIGLEQQMKVKIDEVILQLEKESKQQHIASLHREIERFNALVDAKDQTTMEEEKNAIEHLLS